MAGEDRTDEHAPEATPDPAVPSGEATEESFWDAAEQTGDEPERDYEERLTRSDPTPVGLQNISRSDLREHYGILRTFLKRRGDLFTDLQRQLTQAWIPRTYDQYLVDVIRRAIGYAGVVMVLGFFGGLGLFGGARAGVITGPLPGGLTVDAAATTLVAVGIVLGICVGFGYWGWWHLIYLRSRIARRRREIELTLPYAVTFMYALAQAGVSFDQIVTRLADSQDAYGAVSQEFERVVRDVEMFGANLYGGLENLQQVTPNDALRHLTENIQTVLESGGDLADFLRDEVDDQLERASAAQEQFITRLELLSEVFVVGFVAAPLFVLVVLIVLSFLGANVLTAIGVLVYVVFPLAMVGFYIAVDIVSQPFAERAVSFTLDIQSDEGPASTSEGPAWQQAYERGKRLSGIRQRIQAAATRVTEQPWRVLVFSAPIAVAVPIIGILTGVVPWGLSALLERPVMVTTELVVAPLIIAGVPVAIVYEIRRRQERAIRRRFPELLELLASSNRRGLPLTRALQIVGESTTGRLSDELDRLRNDITWNADLPGAFERLGNRLATPALSRTMTLIAEGSRATSDLHVVLDVAATDTEERLRLTRDREQTLQSYLVIVVLGFLVYLLVVLLLAGSFLDPIERLAATEVGSTQGPVNVGAVPVTELRVILFHSALIQGFGSGVLAGKLAGNSGYNGLKYGIALVGLATVAFMVI